MLSETNPILRRSKIIKKNNQILKTLTFLISIKMAINSGRQIPPALFFPLRHLAILMGTEAWMSLSGVRTVMFMLWMAKLVARCPAGPFKVKMGGEIPTIHRVFRQSLRTMTVMDSQIFSSH